MRGGALSVFQLGVCGGAGSCVRGCRPGGRVWLTVIALTGSSEAGKGEVNRPRTVPRPWRVLSSGLTSAPTTPLNPPTHTHTCASILGRTLIVIVPSLSIKLPLRGCQTGTSPSKDTLKYRRQAGGRQSIALSQDQRLPGSTVSSTCLF